MNKPTGREAVEALSRGLRSAGLDNDASKFDYELSKELMRKVDKWRRQQEDVPSRSKAIRRLVEKGLVD